MKAYTIILLLTALLLLSPTSAKACSCVQRTPCEAFGEASAVFIGRMLGGSEKVREKNTSDTITSIEAGTVRFAVEETFKGSLGATVNLSVSSNINTSCGPYGLTRGERYLVYAYGDAGALSTGVCTRTGLAARAGTKEDMDFLRSLPNQGSGGKVSGRIWAAGTGKGTKPMAGIKVVIRGEAGQNIETVTDKEGKFELAWLKEGKYKVEPVWPEHYANYYPNREVNVQDRACASVGFEASIDGRLTGRVFDINQRPAKVTVSLSEAGSEGSPGSKRGYTNSEGSFEIRGVAPGRYLLHFDLISDDWKSSKKYYYPGVTNPDAATAITIGMGERKGGYEFQLPPDYLVRSVEGQVVWPDGSPAAGVEVMLLCPKSSKANGYQLTLGPPTATANAQGHFKLLGFRGMTYWLEARGQKGPASERGLGEVHSEPREVTLQEDMAEIKLVLSRAGFSGGCGDKTGPRKSK